MRRGRADPEVGSLSLRGVRPSYLQGLDVLSLPKLKLGRGPPGFKRGDALVVAGIQDLALDEGAKELMVLGHLDIMSLMDDRDLRTVLAWRFGPKADKRTSSPKGRSQAGKFTNPE